MEVGEEHADVTVRNSDINISLDQENICTESKCIENNDMNKLQCGQCKRKVHYKCTRLPAYQLQRYLVALDTTAANSFSRIVLLSLTQYKKNYLQQIILLVSKTS